MADSNALGFDDTPFIPGTPWRVHDRTRPHPPVVHPGGESTPATSGAAPSDAIVLFDGRDLSGWERPNGKVPEWRVQDGHVEVVPGTGTIQTREHFSDCQLHVEWAAPAAVSGDSQGRGNSGVFLMGLYEVQVLDCYDNPTYADGTAGAIYGQYPPLVNACRPPGEWQSFDIVFLAPRFDGDQLARPAHMTVFHNGVLVQYHRALLGPTHWRSLTAYTPHPPTGPLALQDHTNPVRFRNIWYRPLPDIALP